MLKEKNQNLLNELSTATAAKQRVQRTKKWVVIFFLVTVTIFYFSSSKLLYAVKPVFAILSHFRSSFQMCMLDWLRRH